MRVPIIKCILEAMHVPRSVFKYIEDYVLTQYKLYLKTGRENASVEIFNIDFSGTRWEFLNKLNPQIRLVVDPSFSTCQYIPTNKINSGQGLIKLGLKTGIKRLLTDGIEHEIAHFIQELIAVYRMKKNGMLLSYNNPYFVKNIGGLPSKKMVQKGSSVYGYITPKLSNIQIDDQDGTIWNRPHKRIPHYRQPIEQLPNLISIIRDLQYGYIQVNNPNLSKKDFLLAILDKWDGLGEYAPIAKSLLKRIKRMADIKSNVAGRNYYKYVLNNIYKLFIDSEYGDDISDKIDAIQNDIKKRFG